MKKIIFQYALLAGGLPPQLLSKSRASCHISPANKNLMIMNMVRTYRCLKIYSKNGMVYILKFWKLVPCQKGIDKQCRAKSDCFFNCFWRSSLIRVFPVCYCDKHFVNFSLENRHFNWEQKVKSVRNFRTYTVILAHRIRISEILPWDRKSYLTHAILPRTPSNVIMWNWILAYPGTSGSLF